MKIKDIFLIIHPSKIKLTDMYDNIVKRYGKYDEDFLSGFVGIIYKVNGRNIKPTPNPLT